MEMLEMQIEKYISAQAFLVHWDRLLEVYYMDKKSKLKYIKKLRRWSILKIKIGLSFNALESNSLRI